ncbi:M48 family metallopeptidase [Ancylomarina sp. DW003]|nr:SprT family zinc-dependent metalloprotease [Ancylomarina sp. DW003]MDE5424133.1 M48 family metallopeptidase [Ancylomarina sp. DW003]
MKVEKKIQIEGLGEVTLKRDSRFKRLSLRMAPNKGIWINVPSFVDWKVAVDFAQSHKDWIAKQNLKIKAKESKNIFFDSNTVFRTKYHELKMNPSQVNRVNASVKQGLIQINYPESFDMKTEGFQDFVRKMIVETLRKEASQVLPKRLEELALRHGFKYNKVSIRNASTRWGSCSGDNNISLNLHLMRLPEHLIDMVLLHELCHTIEKNHSKAFWDLLDKVCSNVSAKKKEMKAYSTHF